MWVIPPLPGPAHPGDPEGMTTCTSAVEISHLRKTYGNLVAVDDVSVSVAEGEIFGILGPNGAGKTTAIECAIGLRQPDAGTVRLLGLDPGSDRTETHRLVGVQLQASAFPAKLRVGEILDMYRSFYRHPADVSELTGALGLAGQHGEYYRSLSGGQRQRLSVALALIGQPRLAVLDEMTTGLDPQARRDAWGGKTVRFVPSGPFDAALLTGLPEVGGVERHGQHVLVTGTGDLVNAVILALAAAGVTAREVQLAAPDLEDAFVALTRRDPGVEHSDDKEGALA